MSAKRWIYVLPLVAIVALVMIFGKRLVDVGQGVDPLVLPSVLINTPLPPFDLAALPGRADTRSLTTSELKGEISMVNVWGSWCIACLEEHPMLMALAREDNVALHGIDWRDTPEAGLAWLKQHGDPYKRVGMDPESQTAIALGVTGAPETFLVDAAGVIRYKHSGPITPEIWHTQIEPVIEKLRQ